LNDDPTKQIKSVRADTDGVPGKDEVADSLRGIFEQTVFGVAQVEAATGRFARINQRYSDIVGYSWEEIENLDFQTITHADDRAEDLANLRLLLAGRIRGFSREKRYLRKDGSTVWVKLAAWPIWQVGEAPSFAIAMVEDITPHKRAEEALAISRQKAIQQWQTTFDSVRDVIWLLDKEHRILQSNRAAERILQCDSGTILGRRSWEVVPGTSEPIPNCPIRRAQASLRRESTELQVGSRWLEITVDPILDQAGAYAGAVHIVSDVTQRRQADAALRESEERYRNIIQHLPLGIHLYELSPNNRLIFLGANPAADAILRTTNAQFIGKSIEEAFPPLVQTEIPEIYRRAARDGIAWHTEQVEYQDGSIHGAFEVHAFQTTPGRMAAVFLDTTERVKAAAEKARLQAELLQAQKMESIGRLAGGVAHDFNNMLQAILGNVDFALEEAPPGSALRENLEEIQKSTLRSADLTRKLLAFARKQTISPKVLDLNDTVPGMLKMLRRLIGEDIQLLWIPGANLWPVRMDPSQLDQILANLTVNARDAIGGVGKVTIETCNVQVGAACADSNPESRPGDYVMLAVGDTGAGLDEETRKHLFEPFYTTKPRGQGTGLGLATVFGIVRQNQGFIDVRSELGKQTVFRLFFPRAESGTTEVEKAAAPPSACGSETILLVEDEQQILDIGRRILEQHGYKVLAARAPDAALALAERHQGSIHLLVTDVVMPGMNGKELKQRLVARRPDMKCLFISGYTSEVIAHNEVLDEGVEFLQKPFTIQALVLRVREVLESGATAVS
jgi:two-component system, cell cycle sensor histidine kinase and response regulator CckA